jgi:hypothetical protein
MYLRSVGRIRLSRLPHGSCMNGVRFPSPPGTRAILGHVFFDTPPNVFQANASQTSYTINHEVVRYEIVMRIGCVPVNPIPGNGTAGADYRNGLGRQLRGSPPGSECAHPWFRSRHERRRGGRIHHFWSGARGKDAEGFIRWIQHGRANRHPGAGGHCNGGLSA